MNKDKPKNEAIYKELCEFIQTELSDILELSSKDLVDIHKDFADFDIDSLTAVELENRLQEHLKGKCHIDNNVLLNFDNIDELATYLTKLISEK